MSPGPDDLVCMEARLDELEKRLGARTRELATDARVKQRLSERNEELARRIAGLEETAARLHREAVAAAQRCAELEELRRACDAAIERLESSLAAERAQRETAQKEIGELREARRMAQAARQKLEGHEAHIDSLRCQVAQLEQAVNEKDELISRARSEAAAEKEAARSALANAESVRREGVEAFEKAREELLALEVREESFRRAQVSGGVVVPAVVEPRRSPATDVEDPSSREPWQVSAELRPMLWVIVCASLVAAMVASVLFLQG